VKRRPPGGWRQVLHSYGRFFGVRAVTHYDERARLAPIRTHRCADPNDRGQQRWQDAQTILERTIRPIALAFICASLLLACGDDDAGVRVKMDFSRPTSLYDAPFPSDDLRDGDAVDVSVFPNPDQKILVEQARGLIAGRRGFATSGGVFFQVEAPIDAASLPALDETVGDNASVFLVGIDPDAPDFGERYPLEVSFQRYNGMYAAPNTIALLPLQGAPLRASTRYAAVVTTAVTDENGEPLARASDGELAGLTDAVDRLAGLGVDVDTIAGLTAFTTGDPMAELLAVRDHALAGTLPAPEAPFALQEVFDDFCVYQTTVSMPDYQSGEPPYTSEGGTWTFDANGDPVLQRMAQARLVVTIPRVAEPSAGYPLVIFVRTGGGGDRPMVDRGRHAEAHGAAVEAGEGPARYFARAGFAGMQIDGPLGGLRNVTNGDEQFLIFNPQNLGAMRDNVRQSAVELVVLAHVAGQLRIDASDCPGAADADAGFDGDHLAIMGHSMGATIAPLAVAAEPRFGAMLLSGAGGSWIENIVYKRKPLELAPIIGLLLGQGFDVRTNDPVLSFAQWALEPADPQVYDRAVVGRHVLMMQGIVDNYILPRIANTTTLSLGLDLGGPARDDTGDPRLEGQSPVTPLLPLVGSTSVTLPASNNAGGATAIVVQHNEGPIEDGHEVVFQTDAPKRQYQCFLATWLEGTPVVPSAEGPCP
jgi:hypothetical protein